MALTVSPSVAEQQVFWRFEPSIRGRRGVRMSGDSARSTNGVIHLSASFLLFLFLDVLKATKFCGIIRTSTVLFNSRSRRFF